MRVFTTIEELYQYAMKQADDAMRMAETYQTIVNLYRQGNSAAQIAKKVGIRPQSRQDSERMATIARAKHYAYKDMAGAVTDLDTTLVLPEALRATVTTEGSK